MAVKALLYVCLAIISSLITVTVFFIYTLFRVKRRYTYHISFTETTSNSNTTKQPKIIGQPDALKRQRNTEQPESQSNADTTNEKDTDSLTRGISFRHFQRPESIGHTSGNTLPETTENEETTAKVTKAPETTNNDSSDSPTGTQSSDSVNWSLSFNNVQKPKVIDNPDTTRHADTTESQETTDNPELSTENTENPETPALSIGSLDLSKEYPELFSKEQDLSTEYPKTRNENQEHTEITDNPDTKDYIKDKDGVTRGLSLPIQQRQETAENSEITGNTHNRFDDIKDKDGVTQGLPLPMQQHPETTENSKITGNPTIMNEPKDTDGMALGISFSNFRARDERKVTFSGNDSTYEIERKTVQQIRIDETSNYGFIKFMKQQ